MHSNERAGSSSDVKLDLSAHESLLNGIYGSGLVKSEDIPNNYHDALTNLTGNSVSGSFNNLTANGHNNTSEFSSCRDLEKSDYKLLNERSFSVGSKASLSKISHTELANFINVSKSDSDENHNSVEEVGVPDGGWGWVVVFSSICISSIVCASYTGFSMYYPEICAAFEASKAETGWIGSLHLATGNFLGIFFSYPIHKYGSRPVCIVGALITFLGYFISSFATSIESLYVTYGLVAGCGMGMVLLGVLVVVQQYFNKRRAMAAGLAAMGFSFGSLSIGPILKFLIDRYTWRGAMFINSAVFLQIIAFSLLYRPLRVSGHKFAQALDGEPPKAHKKRTAFIRVLAEQLRAAFDFSLLKVIPLSLYLISQMLVQISFQTFFQHTPSRAIHYGVDRSLIALLPFISSLGSGMSKFIFSFISNAPCTNRLLMFTVTNALAALTQILTFMATEFTSMMILCAIEGVFLGVGLCVLTTLLVDLVGVENISRSQALLSVSLGTGMLISIPFSGFLFDVTQNYDIPFIVTGILQLIGAVCSSAACVLIKISR